VANTTLTSMFGSLKIRAIEVWTPPASQGSAASCEVDWVGFGNSPNIQFSDSTVSVTEPAHVRCAPPDNSLASFWQVAGTTALCALTAPSGSIIDITLDLVMQDDDISPATSSIASGALAVVYYLSADPNATHYYVPVALSTTH